MYSPGALAAFSGFERLLDPADLLNPGVLVRPRPLDADLRRPAALPLPRLGGFAFGEDDGDLTTAVHRCVGVAKCRADSSGSGGFMCPSYLATRDEKDSTRGRARVLQDMANGTLISGGWRSPEVHDSLDLCLSCKACSADCPAGVDMARYKSEVAYRAYRRRLRPRSHYALGWLPRWSRGAGVAPRLVNALLRIGPLATAVLAAGGMDTRRVIPSFAPVPFRRSNGSRSALRHAPASGGSSARWCCGPTPSATPSTPGCRRPRSRCWAGPVPGDRPRTFRVLRADLDQHRPAGRGAAPPGLAAGHPRPVRRDRDPHRRAGTSCTAVLRSDLADLFPGDSRAAAVAAATRTLAELLTAPPPLGPGPQGPRRTWPAPRSSPSRTATTTR